MHCDISATGFINVLLFGAIVNKKENISSAQNTSVKTALRVIEMIELFAHETQPLSLSEIARALDVPVSSCLALIRTLTQSGYLYETGKRQGYYPTGRLYTMAQRIYQSDPILEQIRPSLEELRNTTEETVVLGKLNADMKVVYIEVIQSLNPIRYVAVAGMQRSLHANSIGKALLSCLDESERKKILSQSALEAFTPRTKTDLIQLEEELQASKQQGWFSNLGESIADVAGIAWPLYLNGTCYAVSIAGPIYRIQDNVVTLAQRLRTACRLIDDREMR